MQEVKRLLIAMQHSDEHKIAAPADWQPGEDYECLAWFPCLKECPHGRK